MSIDESVFKNLVENKQELVGVVVAIESAVKKSFDRKHGLIYLPEKMARPEVERRINICLKIFKVLRGDLQWTLARTKDYLYRYLCKELDGESWEPDKRASWATNE